MALPSYELRWENREQYLFAYVTAERLTIETARGYMTEIAEVCRAQGISKVLVVRDIPEVFGDAGQFGIAQEALELFRGIKICWVNPYAEIQPSLDFAALVAANRGAQFKVLTNESAAAAWLTGNQS